MGCGSHLDDGWCTYLDQCEVACNRGIGCTWQVFVKALKAQFEPLSKEVCVREQIQKLVQTNNVNNYICCFLELQNEIPSMNLEEAYLLFMHGLNPQLCQLARTMVISGDLEEDIEIVKKATVYGEERSSSSSKK